MQGARTTTTDPWEAQQEPLKYGFGQARGLYDLGAPSYYPGQSLAGFDPVQTEAQRRTLGYAMGPRPAALQAGAENVTLGQMAGQTPFSGGQMTDLLAGNVPTGQGTPYGDLANVYRQQAESQMQQGLANVRQGMVGSMNMPVQPGGGSRGDLAQERVLAQGQKAIAQNLAQMYGGAYGAAQGMRMPAAGMQIGQQAAGQAAYPTIMGAPLALDQAIGSVGEQRRAMSQEGINRDIAQYQYEATAPQNALQNYMAMISGDYGSAVTQPAPSGISQLGSIASVIGALAPAF